MTQEATSLHLTAPVALHYQVNAGITLSRHLRGLRDGRFIGHRCRRCKQVLVPALGSCPICAVPTSEAVLLTDTATLTTVCIVHIPVRGQGIELPFASANVLIDGADTPFLALVQGCPVTDVKAGMRVRARWRKAADRCAGLDSLECFEPIDEAPVDVTALTEDKRRQLQQTLQQAEAREVRGARGPR